MDSERSVRVGTADAPEFRVVGDYYDHEIFEVMKKLGDGNMHYGYWAGDDDRSTFEEAMERMTTEMVRRLDPKPGARILDVGCGNGTPGVRLARDHHVEVVGITVSERQVARASERAQAAGLADRARFEYATAMDLPYPAGSFDGAWALESMLHMPDKARVLSEIARVLRPGGRLAIADMIYRSSMPPGGSTATDAAMYASLAEFGEYAKLLEGAGLIPLEIKDVTAETSRSSSCLAEWMRSQGEQYVRILGAKGRDLLLSNQESISLLPQLGYVLITAQRP